MSLGADFSKIHYSDWARGDFNVKKRKCCKNVMEIDFVEQCFVCKKCGKKSYFK
jgi:predicted alpha/beta hydrolase